MDILTARELFQDIRDARQHVREAVNNYEQANVDLVNAAIVFEEAEARAFVEAKAAGSTDSLAQRQATLATLELKKARDAAKARKQSANLESSAWQKIVDAYAATSYALNRELKLEETGNAA